MVEETEIYGNPREGPTLRFDKTTKVVTCTIPAGFNFDDETEVIATDTSIKPAWMMTLLWIRDFVRENRKE